MASVRNLKEKRDKKKLFTAECKGTHLCVQVASVRGVMLPIWNERIPA